MKRAFAVLSMLALISACNIERATAPRAWTPSGPSLDAATVIHTQDKVPVPLFIVAIPCVPENAVVTDAELHVVTKSVINSGGRISLSSHFQPIGNWDGVGSVTGDTYQATGVTLQDENSDNITTFPFETTYINNFRWIGPGPGNNVLVHTVAHVTINANGDITVNKIDTSSECK
jgi:hypothetical protein